jgi:uncharacterized protein involved in exopolysaccharide biosynthesis
MSTTSREQMASSRPPGAGDATASVEREHLFVRLWVRRRFLAAFGFSCAVAVMALSMVTAKTYAAEAALAPPMESRDIAALGTLLPMRPGALESSAMSSLLPGAAPSLTDTYMALLKSRRMADEIITRLDLTSAWSSENQTLARQKLSSVTTFNVTKEKTITIRVLDKDPVRAAAIANEYLANLDKMSRQISTSRAAQVRAFLEKRVSEVKAALAASEERVRDFQQKNGAIAIDVQSEAMLDAGSQIQAQLTTEELRLATMRRYLSEDNIEIDRLRTLVAHLRKHLSSLKSGALTGSTGEKNQPGLSNVPKLQLDYVRLARDVKTYEMIHMQLNIQLEQAKLLESRDATTVQVLDRAEVPEVKFSPRITRNTLIAGMVSFLIGTFWIYRGPDIRALVRRARQLG